MTKKEIVKQISERIGLTELKTKDIVQVTFDAIVDTLLEEKRIELRNFGVVEVKQRKARKARNPRTGDSVDVAASASRPLIASERPIITRMFGDFVNAIQNELDARRVNVNIKEFADSLAEKLLPKPVAPVKRVVATRITDPDALKLFDEQRRKYREAAALARTIQIGAIPQRELLAWAEELIVNLSFDELRKIHQQVSEILAAKDGTVKQSSDQS